LSDIDTVILAGGLGTRLMPVLKDIPKCLAPINGRPFIDIILDNCIDQGLQRFIICVGYLKEQVIEYLRDRNDCEIVFAKEEELLGTGGALKNAEKYLTGDQFLVLNGDTFVPINYNRLIDWHRKINSFLTMVINYSNNTSRYGSVRVDKNSKIIKFVEKDESLKAGWVNAGGYLMNKAILEKIAAGANVSLEKDLFLDCLGEDFFGFKNQRQMIDIGIPASYKKAQKRL